MLKENPKWLSHKGFYARVGNAHFGVYSTSEGPIFFVNHDRYDLKQPCWDFEMVMGPSVQIIHFYWYGEVKLSVHCKANYEMFMPLYDYLSLRKPFGQLA